MIYINELGVFMTSIDHAISRFTDADTHYWYFSAAAQTIGTFIAFILTGYAIVITILSDIESKDETLTEIHAQLRRDYHSRMTLLAVLTGVSIISSLCGIVLNKITYPFKWLVLILSLFLIAAIVILGINFVLSIVDPDKYTKTATSLRASADKKMIPSGTSITAGEFLARFIAIEKDLRDFIESSDFFRGQLDYERQVLSFRRMIEILRLNNLIQPNERDELMGLNQYRNLVAHGRQEQVDTAVNRRIEVVRNIIEDAKAKYSRRRKD